MLKRVRRRYNKVLNQPKTKRFYHATIWQEPDGSVTLEKTPISEEQGRREALENIFGAEAVEEMMPHPPWYWLPAGPNDPEASWNLEDRRQL